MSHDPQTGVETFGTTFFEKFLAVVLAGFLLVGAMWAYFIPLDTRTDAMQMEPCADKPAAYFADLDEEYLDDPARSCVGTAADHAAEMRLLRAQNGVDRLQTQVDTLAADRDEQRERYRTSLDAGTTDDAARTAYDQAERKLAQTRAQQEAAQRAVDAARPEGDRAKHRIDALLREQERDRQKKLKHAEKVTFLSRLAFISALLVGGFVLLQAQRRRHSRWTVLGMSVVGAATISSFVFAADYLNIEDWGPLIISMIGVALTVAVFLAYQRFLKARIPRRRVRKCQCMYCGYPVADSTHCEGCGREAHAGCASCGERRRVGALHCGSCGAA